MSPAKRKLLAERLKSEASRESAHLQVATCPLEAVPRDGDLPLSFAQQRLWFLHQMEPDSPFYNNPAMLRLRGQLREQLLEATLNNLVARHETLRTSFKIFDDRPVQIIDEPSDLIWYLVDLSDLPNAEGVALQNARSEVLRPFDLRRAPLIRVVLYRIGKEDHLLLLNLHHIISDAWSIGVLVREVTLNYQSLVDGVPPELPDPPVQYADYAVWQRNQLEGEALQSQLSYWLNQLEGIPATLELPTDHPRPAVQSYRGTNYRWRLSSNLSQSLRQLSLREGMTQFMTLLAAFNVLLCRYTGQQDITVGTPIANRTRPEIESLIGFFTNTLVLRTDLSGNPTYLELLAKVRAVALEAYTYQDLPFEKLVEQLQPERNLSRSPLFQVMFVLQNRSQQELRISGLEIEDVQSSIESAKFDLTLSMTEMAERIQASFEYSIDLFESQRIERLAGHFDRLLEGIVANPGRRIWDLPLLSEAEMAQIVDGWNLTGREFDTHSVHEFFLKQALVKPETVAVVYQDQHLTYGKLEARANQLAHYLKSLGIELEHRVGLCLRRSVEQVVAILGILKAGGCYVPLDPEYPIQRLRMMVTDAGMKALITESELIPDVAEMAPVVVRLDVECDEIEREARGAPGVEVKPDNLVYVIYTSGSTGRPKGVALSHAALTNLLNWCGLSLRPDARMLQFSSISFDASFLDIFCTLCYGGTIVLITSEEQRDLRALAKVVRKERIERVNLPAAATGPLIGELAALGESGGEHLLELISTAEQMQLSQNNWEWLQNQRIRVWNHYGPAETHVITAFDLSGDEQERTQHPPIGSPIANCWTYVLDREIQPVPVGVYGEIYLGGTGVGRGYLNRESLTAERFIPDPFSKQPGARAYRTGDLTRYLPDGNIEFLGRMDHQVKIRGFRVELGEIEETLRQHQSVREAVVLIREDSSVIKKLVAYLTPQPEGVLDQAALQKFLRQRLPAHMIPSAFIALNALPLTPNGKLDRRALPSPAFEETTANATRVMPRTRMEEVVAAAWAEVLGIERVGVHDNFFELGGHSLLATQVISRLCAELQAEIAVRALFESPTVAGLAAGIETTVGERRSHSTPMLQPCDRNGALPLSFAQERLWFLHQLEPKSAAYNLPQAMRLIGRLNIAALEQTLNEIVRKHEVLRTIFDGQRGELVQIIAPPHSMALPIRDLRSLPEMERAAEAQRLAVRDALQPFDLTRGPALRANLLQLGDADHIILFTTHHISSDGWSLGVLIQEVMTIYNSVSQGLPSPLQELPIQYVDFAVWQRQWLTGDLLEAQLEYWKRQLGDSVPVLEIPTDRVCPANKSFHGAHHPFIIPQVLKQQLARLSRQGEATLFMTMLAAFQALLSRYSGQENIVVGAPIANRNRVELERLIGCFVNILVLRADLSGNPTFRVLLQRVREVALGAYAHQDLPFEKLAENYSLKRDLGRNPLVRTVFVLHNTPIRALELVGLQARSQGLGAKVARFDLEFQLWEGLEGLEGGWVYSTDLFDARTIEQMAGHFLRLLEGIVSAPDRRLIDLPLLSDAERRQMLAEWNNRARHYSSRQSIQQLFEEQVEGAPDRVAIIADDQQLTYQQLNQRANLLARYLRDLGVEAETIVALYMERSLEMVVAILGVLKAGGAYLPLDPGYPKERLAFMLEDSQALIVLTQETLVDGLPQNHAKVVRLDRDWHLICRHSKETLISHTQAENSAYVIYTSGSTGRPKGVIVKHTNVVCLFEVTQAQYQFSQDDSWVLFHSYAFDFSVWEIWGALFNGGRLVIIPYWVSRSPDAFYDLLIDEQLTVLNQTPSAFRQLIQAEQFRTCVKRLALRLLIFGGEALELQSLGPWFSRHGDQHPILVNMYGITETTVHVTIRLLKEEDLKLARGSVIGKVLDGLEIYILDNELQPVPIGVNGELYVGGTGLARGYLRRPELTAERFVPNPFNSRDGSRLYKTGDLARYLADGDIEYLGRIDHQVKIRGFRIESGEVESELNKYPAVRESLVLARDGNDGERQLVGYLVVENGDVSIGAIRSYLKDRLPEYMIPSTFVTLDAFPLTNNGKIDRDRLQIPEQNRPELQQRYVAPQTELEENLAAIWAEVLRLEQVGIHDNFFDLGGHSLLAIRITLRVRQALNVDLPLRRLFESPTIAELAVDLERELKAGSKSTPPTIKRIPRDQKFPLSFAQQRLWFLDQLEMGSPFYNIPVTIRLTGSLSTVALEESLNELIRRHEVLRTVFTEVEGQPIQVISPTLTLRILTVELRGFDLAERERLARRIAFGQARKPFDLAIGPLVRVLLLRLGEQDHVLALTIHHIITDGWSMDLMINHLAAAYRAISAGIVVIQAEPSIQYVDFAYWQRNWLQGEVLESQLTYWKNKLKSASPILRLPTDRPRPGMQTYRGATRSLALSSHMANAVRKLSLEAGVTLFVTLLAAFKVLLFRYTGQEDIIIGTPAANRNQVETENQLGLFANTLALRTILSGDPTFREIILRVHNVVLEANVHQDLPFEKIVEALHPERSLSYTPLFQVVFTMRNASRDRIHLPDLIISRLPFETQTAQFDLGLGVNETDDGMTAFLNYRIDLFNPDTVDRMLKQYQTLLECISIEPQTRLKEIVKKLAEIAREQQMVEDEDREKITRQNLKGARRKSISLDGLEKNPYN
jgi:amino acid adenylation domain-containing protein